MSATLISPHIAYYVSSFILSLFWPRFSDMPQLGLMLPLETFPMLVGAGALAYCLSEIPVSNRKTKLAILFLALMGIVIFGLIVGLITSCSVFHDCP